MKQISSKLYLAVNKQGKENCRKTPLTSIGAVAIVSAGKKRQSLFHWLTEANKAVYFFSDGVVI